MLSQEAVVRLAYVVDHRPRCGVRRLLLLRGAPSDPAAVCQDHHELSRLGLGRLQLWERPAITARGASGRCGGAPGVAAAASCSSPRTRGSTRPCLLAPLAWCVRPARGWLEPRRAERTVLCCSLFLVFFESFFVIWGGDSRFSVSLRVFAFFLWRSLKPCHILRSTENKKGAPGSEPLKGLNSHALYFWSRPHEPHRVAAGGESTSAGPTCPP
jgi:hypothetical protein